MAFLGFLFVIALAIAAFMAVLLVRQQDRALVEGQSARDGYYLIFCAALAASVAIFVAAAL